MLRCEQARRSGGKLDECIRLFAEVLRERSLTVGKPQPCRQIAGIDDVRARRPQLFDKAGSSQRAGRSFYTHAVGAGTTGHTQHRRSHRVPSTGLAWAGSMAPIVAE